MSFLRTLSRVAVSAVLCALLSPTPVASQPSSSGAAMSSSSSSADFSSSSSSSGTPIVPLDPFVPTRCTPLVGDASLFDYPNMLSVGFGNIIQAVGYFTTNATIEPYSQFVFDYVVPDQTGYQTPNRLKFAVYLNDHILGTANSKPGPTLIAQSQTVTIEHIPGVQNFTARTVGTNTPLQPNTNYVIAVWNEFDYVEFVDTNAKQKDEVTLPYDASSGFPRQLPYNFTSHRDQFPAIYSGCNGKIVGDPVFTGFNGEKFLVKGEVDRVYNVLSTPALQLNTRFIELVQGQAMNHSEQAGVRARQSKMLSALRGAGAGNRLPSTVSWSHDGLYMGETGVQLAGHRLLVVPGSYVSGFSTVELDGAVLPVSATAVQLLDGSLVQRMSSSVVEVTTADVLFTLVNSDHFVNIHSAVLRVRGEKLSQVDGLLGQTAQSNFHVSKSETFTQHVENDYRLPQGEDVWSTNFPANHYVKPASSN